MFKKPKLKVAKIYKKIASYRFEPLHKTPYQWVIQYDLKAAEDLKVKKTINYPTILQVQVGEVP